MFEEYIKLFCEGFDFKPHEKCSNEICGVTVESEVMLYSEGIHRRTKSHVVFSKGDKTYECDCVDLYLPFLSVITVNGKEYICFSRCLYGFIFLSLDNLKVEYEYFPEKVLRGEESFIITEARNLGKLLIFDGCYWACPYGLFAYDHESRRFFPLSEEFGLIYDVEATINDGILTVTGRDLNNKERELSFSEQDVKALIDREGKYEF